MKWEVVKKSGIDHQRSWPRGHREALVLEQFANRLISLWTWIDISHRYGSLPFYPFSVRRPYSAHSRSIWSFYWWDKNNPSWRISTSRFHEWVWRMWINKLMQEQNLHLGRNNYSEGKRSNSISPSTTRGLLLLYTAPCILTLKAWTLSLIYLAGSEPIGTQLKQLRTHQEKKEKA